MSDIKPKDLKGGAADNKSIEDIAHYHNVDVAGLKCELAYGIEVEQEHTKNKKVAEQIAKDHLMESPKYYRKLKTMEANLKKATLIPPDYGTIPGLDAKSAIDYSKRHDALANDYASVKDTARAAHHRKQAELYSANVSQFSPAKKSETEVESSDGQIKRLPGKEPLMKPMAKSLLETWALLKADISANNAFMSLQPEDQEEDRQVLHPDTIDQIHSAIQPDGAAQSEPPSGEGEELQPSHIEDLAQQLREQGFSEAEIQHILAEEDQSDAAQPSAAGADASAEPESMPQEPVDPEAEHKRALMDIERKKKQAELDMMDPQNVISHAQRMRDIEYQKAQQALQLELEAKRAKAGVAPSKPQ